MPRRTLALASRGRPPETALRGIEEPRGNGGGGAARPAVAEEVWTRGRWILWTSSWHIQRLRTRDGKYDHLNKFENASENLKLFEADLLDYNSLHSAIKGCTGVLHVASPVPSSSVQNPEIELLEPAVKGTLNVLKACSKANVKRVVYVSSISAIVMNPMWPKERVKDETCWSDKDYCITTKNWYGLSKREAESAAVEFAKGNGLDMVRICPALVFGPLLQSRVNASSLVLIKLMEGTYLRLVNDGDDSMPNKLRNLVDVRDVAAAVLLGYENLEAEGRYVCTAHAIKTRDLVVKLRSSYPNYSYPQNGSKVQTQTNKREINAENKPNAENSSSMARSAYSKRGDR